MRCRYSAVNFLSNIHKRHPIARPLGRGMGCLLCIQQLIDILPQFMQPFMQSLIISHRVKTTLDCITRHRFFAQGHCPANGFSALNTSKAVKGVMRFSHDDVIKWKIFLVTGPLGGEFTGHWWIPLTKASDAELFLFFDLRLNKRLSKQAWGWWIGTPSHPLWRHCNKCRC